MAYWKNGVVAMLLLPSILSGCVILGSGTPEWVLNPKTVYPENQYLVAVGEGDTRRAAENSAAANLSRIFEAHIKSDERILDQSRETGNSFERTTDFTADINILSSQTLYNIQHAEAWQDDKGRVHAVAYLNRRETAVIYRDKIGEQTTLVNFLLAQAEQTDDLLKKYATLRAAVRHATEAKYLLQQLKVIHPPSVPGATPSYTENKIHTALAETAKQIRVQVSGEDGSLSRSGGKHITASLEELFTRYGFVIGKPAVLKASAVASITDTGQRNAELIFVRYELRITIRDTQVLPNRIILSVNEKGREAHISIPEARNRSFRTMDKFIQTNGAQRLDAYFDFLVDPMPE